MTTRPLPPPLEARCPDCSMCGAETEYYDEGFNCGPCAASWPDQHPDEPGAWDDPDADQCRWTAKGHANTEYRCLLGTDHKGGHNHPEIWNSIDTWEDPDGE